MQSEKVLKSTVLYHTSHNVNLIVAPPVLEVGGAANVLGLLLGAGEPVIEQTQPRFSFILV